MAYFEIGYIEQYCEKYDKTEWDGLNEAAYKDGEDTYECPIFSAYACDCKYASDRIKYKGFNLKKYDISKNDDLWFEPDLLILETNTRNYLCFYLKMDDQILIDLRDDYKEQEGEVDE